MKDLIKGNWKTLKELLDAVIATDQTGKIISFDEAIEDAIGLVMEQNANGGKLIFIGNGGSAAIASHMATDFWKNGGIRAVAFNDPVLLTCLSNDHGYREVFERSVEMFGESRDFLIAISSSGQSENILRAAEASLKKGLKIVTLSGFKSDNPLRTKGDINFYVPSCQYGFVEVIHHAVCHCCMDMILQNKSTLKERVKCYE